MGITLGEALGSIKNFLLGRNNQPPQETNEEVTEIMCPKCNKILGLFKQYINDFNSVIIYKCYECGAMKEYQYDSHGSLLKEINMYSKFPSSISSYSEVLADLEFNLFSLDRLWLINNTLCFPVLMKSDMSSNINLIFVRVGVDLSHDDIKSFIINDYNIISEAIISKNNSFSFFFNPYLARLPHPELNYKSNYSNRSEFIEYISNIRYQHKIMNIENRIVHTITIIKDYPLENYGIEIYIKFLTYDNSEEEKPIIEILNKIDFKNLIMHTQQVNVDINYSIQSSHIRKINEYSISGNNIDDDQRMKLCEDIESFFEII